MGEKYKDPHPTKVRMIARKGGRPSKGFFAMGVEKLRGVANPKDDVAEAALALFRYHQVLEEHGMDTDNENVKQIETWKDTEGKKLSDKQQSIAIMVADTLIRASMKEE